ncbi:uncharacterized protein LOC111034262 [Myzus persicae]|uniref:uncharacterized protein LOC111034262 n=1 Tax=Myzus persicae TaxID=13164 RepID=UPI000B93728D|nr:uncharacterized protein LOC111034262 [Myzus persicae]
MYTKKQFCENTDHQPIILLSRSNATTVNWFDLCTDMCCSLFEKRQKMGGQNIVVQMDESLLRGRRKYNRGRLLLGDGRHEQVQDNTTDSNSDSDQENLVDFAYIRQKLWSQTGRTLGIRIM